MSDKPRPRRIKKSTPMLGSVSERVKARADGSEYIVYRAQHYHPHDRARKVEQTFSQLMYGGGKRGALKAESEAHRWLETQREAITGGTWVDPREPTPIDPGMITVAQVAEEWRATWEHRLSPNTRVGYASILDGRVLPYWKDRRVCDIASRDVQAWVTELAGAPRKPAKGAKLKQPTKLHPTTVKRVYNVLRVCLRYAVRQGYIAANPCNTDSIELPSRARRSGGSRQVGVALNREQMRALLAALPEHYRTPVELTLCTGLRAAELWGLTRADWNATEGTIRIAQTLSDIGGHLVAGVPKTEESEAALSVPPSLHAALNTAAAAPGVMRKLVGGRRGYPAIIETGDGSLELALVPDVNDVRRLLFLTPTAAAVSHGNFYRKVFKPTVQALWPKGHPLHAARFHDLRHLADARVMRPA
jgi:integrase